MTFDGVLVGERFQRAMEKFQRAVEGGLVGPLCSLNPHDETVVARRTRGGPSQATLPEEMRASLEGALYRALIGLLCSPTAYDRKLIRLEKLRVV